MEWLPLVSTAVGVLLGVGATTFNERIKWKRERWKADRDVRTKLYGEYIANLTSTRDALRLVAIDLAADDPARKQAANRAFAAGNIYAPRYQIEVTAADEVTDAAYRTFALLREMRDLVGDGEPHRSERYLEWRGRYDTAYRNLRQTLKADLDLGRDRRP